MTRVCVVVPTYNERENISRVVSSILDVLRSNAIDGWMLIVDDASPDGTGLLADELSGKHSNVHVIHREGKLGIGSAYKEGFSKALEDSLTSIVVEMDADLSHDPIYLPSIVDAAEKIGGVAVGSRYVPGGGVVGWPVTRKLVSAGANFLTRAFLGLRVKDATSGYRAYTREVLTSIDYVGTGTRAYAFQVEMLQRCANKGLPIREVPIRFQERKQGKSKLTKTDIFDFLKTLMRLRFRT